MAVVNPMNPTILNPAVKDSRWLTLEVCREYQRNKCTRTENECKFAHPPPHVEVQNGRVVACFDSIKGKCQRKEPPCKYLHPPQHLREQLLQNGRNNLILRSLQMHAYQQPMMQPAIIPLAGHKAVAYPTTAVVPGQIPYMTTHFLSTVPTSAVAGLGPYGLPAMAAMQSGAQADATTIVTSQIPGVITTPVPNKAPAARPDRLELSHCLSDRVGMEMGCESLVSEPSFAVGCRQQPQYVIPPFKRLAVDTGGSLGGKGGGGLPTVYHHQPTTTLPAPAAYHQPATLMQLQQQQQPSYPITYSGDVMPAAYSSYLPQVAGHPPTVPRF